MTSAELGAYIRALKQELAWRPKSGPVHKSVSKQLEVAEKLRELQYAREVAGEI